MRSLQVRDTYATIHTTLLGARQLVVKALGRHSGSGVNHLLDPKTLNGLSVSIGNPSDSPHTAECLLNFWTLMGLHYLVVSPSLLLLLGAAAAAEVL